MTREKALEELERIQTDLQSFRTKHGQAAYEYYTEKAEYESKLSRYYIERHNENKTLSKAAIETEFRTENETLYNNYKQAKGHMEGLDRTLRNLDAQRSIIQTILNQLDEKTS